MTSDTFLERFMPLIAEAGGVLLANAIIANYDETRLGGDKIENPEELRRVMVALAILAGAIFTASLKGRFK